MNFRISIFSAVVVFTYSVSVAAEHKMICKNPRQEYLAVFDDVANTLLVSAPGLDVAYQVERIEKDGSGLIVRGSTTNGGPNFVAHTGKKKSINFLEGGKVIQTDECE